jgi:hypothetical protein
LIASGEVEAYRVGSVWRIRPDVVHAVQHPNDSITADQWVEEMLAKAPALTSEQRTQLAELLEPVRRRPAIPSGAAKRARRIRKGSAA